MKSILASKPAWLLGALAITYAPIRPAHAQDAGEVDAGTPDGAIAPECTSSAECGPPTPYCSGECVECLADLHCSPQFGYYEPGYGGAMTCFEGRCVQCKSDAECAAPTPYCDLVEGSCVECLSDRNCSIQGLACTDGKCGSCGDSICSFSERPFNCEQDCRVCGDGLCVSGLETACSCPADCAASPICGDGCCSEGEDTACPRDCNYGYGGYGGSGGYYGGGGGYYPPPPGGYYNYPPGGGPGYGGSYGTGAGGGLSTGGFPGGGALAGAGGSGAAFPGGSAGTPSSPDGGPDNSADPGADPFVASSSGDDGGCGCRTVATSKAPVSLLAAIGLLTAAGARRRRWAVR